MNYSMQGIAMAIVYVALTSGSQVYMKSRVQHLEEKSQQSYIVRFVTDPGVLAAYAVSFGALLIWLRVLQLLPLAVAYTVFGTSFIFVPLFSNMFLREPMTMRSWLGSILIFAGVIVVLLS